LGFGINTKAAILTRGLAEISRLGVQMGALKETFVGSSGVGDLATTCMSLDSRNRSFGEQIAKGNTLDQILKNTQSVVEGIATTESAYQLANEYNVDMPITNQIYEVIYNNKDPKLAVKELMTRTLKDE
jgi:glycerol-3-phosphate dehydrogenase (NAD(P)+)